MALFPSKGQVGLYVDSETITVLNGQIAGTAIDIAGFVEMRGRLALDEGPEKKQAALDQLKLSLNRAGVAGKSVLLAVPGEGSMTRHFELPMLPKKEERNAVRFEAQKYVPFDIKDLYYDYETYPDTERKRTGVVFFACKKQWVDSLSSLLLLCGLKVTQVELVSQSIARAYHRHAASGSGEVSLVIAANDNKTGELLVQKQGSVLTTRHLSFSYLPGSESLDLPMFASDIRISMDYFAENFKNLKIQRIYLVVPFAGETQTACDALSRELSLPVDSGPVFQAPSAVTSTTAAIAAYGLTLGALEKRGVKRINLSAAEAASMAPAMSWEEEKKQLHNLAVRELLGIIVFFAAIFVVLTGTINSKNQELMQAMGAYPKAETASIGDPAVELQDKQTALMQKMAVCSSLVDRRIYLTYKLNELAKMVPPVIQLAQLSYADELNPQGTSEVTMRLDGYILAAEGGSELAPLNKLVSQMLANPVFMEGIGEIRILSTKKVLLGAVPATKFTLDCSKKKV